ncbi:Nucleolar protein 12 (25kDa) [Nesidiocoris tenuis]|uniref:Nucleolar protein 12 n=1 Tax=Nesidiocoris tenuis TaxID=355587 RepID=A0ABN7BAF4_9HEMI|nr:Nucleolar protein 12 (25kDa) [Nesidiocoris tenuis]
MDSDEDTAPIVTAKRRRKPINKKTKVHLVFDENARKEFLTGFRKRKLQRQKKAQEELKEILKAEKKRIRQEAKEQYKKMVQSYKPIPELEEQLAKEYEVENATVSVLELDTDLLAETNFLIGRNRGQCEEPEIKEEKKIEDEPEEMPGMELKAKSEKPVKKPATPAKPEPAKEAKTKKELRKAVKKQSTKIVKNSKAFQKMNQLHTLKQKKKSSIKRREMRKSRGGQGKKPPRGAKSKKKR